MTYKEVKEVIDKQAECVMRWATDGCNKECENCQYYNTPHVLVVAYAIVSGMLENKLKEGE